MAGQGSEAADGEFCDRLPGWGDLAEATAATATTAAAALTPAGPSTAEAAAALAVPATTPAAAERGAIVVAAAVAAAFGLRPRRAALLTLCHPRFRPRQWFQVLIAGALRR